MPPSRAPSPSCRRQLADLTWPQAEKAFSRTRLAVVPLGSIEQHGPHLPLGTDWLIARRLSELVAERTDCLVTPTIPVGFADYHSDFPGTLSVPSDVLAAYVSSIVGYLLRYGVTHVLFLNGHGGNLTALNEVMAELRELGVVSATVMWWEVSGALDPAWALRGHGDVVETSLALAVCPELVDLGAARLPSNAALTPKIGIADGRSCVFEGGGAKFFLRTRDVSPSGDFIEYGHSAGADYGTPPTAATAENGRALLEALAGWLERFLAEFVKVRFEPVGEGTS